MEQGGFGWWSEQSRGSSGPSRAAKPLETQVICSSTACPQRDGETSALPQQKQQLNLY